MPKIKSKVFARFDPHKEENKEFQKDLNEALGLPEKARSACLKAVIPYLSTRLPSDEERLLSTLEKETGLPRVEFEGALHVMAFFLRAFVEPETRDDDPKDWSHDLVELGLIRRREKERQACFESMVKALKAQSAKYEQQALYRSYAAGVLPVFKSCGHTIELRAVQEGKYEWGEDVKTYSPQIVNFAPMVSVHVGLDTGTPSDFYFQLREEHLDYLIGEFEAAKKELNAFKQFIKEWQEKPRREARHNESR